MWFAISLLACHSAVVDEPSHDLTVTGGFGGGSFPQGTEVHVWAGVDPQLELADWSGTMLPDPPEWNSTLEMPDTDVSLTVLASPVAAPLNARTYPTAAGDRNVLVSSVNQPVGVVLFFHGASYSIDQLRSNAGRTLTMTLVRAGYTVVALPSEAEVAAGKGGWNADLAETNPDLVTTRALVAALQADGTIPGETPIYAMGMSSGGMYAHTVGAVLPTAGVVAYCAPGSPAALDATSAPTGWFLAANDQTFPTAVSDANGFSAGLSARGITNQIYVHPTTPLYDARFTRITGVDLTRSKRLSAALRAAGAVDENDEWVVTGSSVTAGLDLDGLDGLDALQLEAVVGEIEIMAADHELYDDAANRMVTFLDSMRN